MLNKTPKDDTKKIKWVHRTLIAYIFLAVVFAIVIGANHEASSPQRQTMQLGNQKLNLEIANTDAARTQGLSDRPNLAKNSAMLFIFPDASEQCMWMKDMKFSLDMVWMDASKRIVKLAPDVSPDTYPQFFCADNTKYVLEMNVGVIKKHTLEVGQNLNF